MSDFKTPEKMQIRTPSDMAISDSHPRANDILKSFDSREWNYITPQKMPMNCRDLEMFSGKGKYRFESINKDGLDGLLSDAIKELAEENLKTVDLEEMSKSKDSKNRENKNVTEFGKIKNSNLFDCHIDEIFRFITPKKKLVLEDKDSKEKVGSPRTELSLEMDSFKKTSISPCTCKKSKCLKLYCECFKAGLFCSIECRCSNCQNFDDRNHPKISIQLSIPKAKPQGVKQTSFCNCLMSSCAKKYCDCHKADRLCNSSCRCRDCKNR